MSPFVAAGDRYAGMPYRRAGRSGLKLPAVSLGLWHNFGDDKPLDVQRAVLRRAFDLGVTHFDLANNYGPPPGSAEANFGRHFAADRHHSRRAFPAAVDCTCAQISPAQAELFDRYGGLPPRATPWHARTPPGPRRHD